MIYNSEGEEELPVLAEENEPTGVAVDSSGAVYVLFSPGTVKKYTPVGNPVTTADFTSSLLAPNEGQDLLQIALDSTGEIYLASTEGKVTRLRRHSSPEYRLPKAKSYSRVAAEPLHWPSIPQAKT